ncbi:MAG TPA: ABC transporter ATP-binding protein [Clostridiales bacterium]|nr:ABC transporter ATP-binding protein [Clostridiales bacterium]
MNIVSKHPVAVHDLSWKYGERIILRNINLKIERGRFYGIIGPNGSGKTTLLRNISKSLVPAAKAVYIDDLDAAGLSSRDIAKKLAVVPQSTNVEFDFTVTDIVLMGRNPYIRRFGSESRADMEIAEKAMKATNTWHLKDKCISEISGGERQRVIIARALAQDTAVMLLDEPVSQLDIHHQIEIMELICSLTRGRALTAVSVMHDLNLAAQYSDFLILISEGIIVCQGTPQQVITKENLKNVYHLDSFIVNNPVTGKPYIMHVEKLKKHVVYK